MAEQPKPVPAEALVGKDELDEDDEMLLSGDDLVEDRSGADGDESDRTINTGG